MPIVLTAGNKKSVEIGNGGSSLASPIFTAIWAITQQKAGHPLGQASPTIAGLTSGITDVLPLSSPDNISGSVTDTKGTTVWTAKALLKDYIPTPTNQHFIAAIWDQPQYSQSLGFAFGLESTLTVTKGWDSVTGYGTPYGLAFIRAAAAFGAK